MSGTLHSAECKQASRRFSLGSATSSNEDTDARSFLSLTASKSRPKTPTEKAPERNYRAELKQAQNALVKGDKNLAHNRCIDLINGPNLPADIKLETIQIMSTTVPLDQACSYLEDAIRIATDLTLKEPKEMLWRGLLATTHDLLWMVHKRIGAVKFHRDETFRDPYVAARVRDIEKNILPCQKTLYKRLGLIQTQRYTTLSDYLKPKFSCSPSI